MGLYPIPCRVCQKPFIWFSGNLSQACDDCRAQPRPCWNCGTAVTEGQGRHAAPCGAVCAAGSAMNVPDGERPHIREEEMHSRPWEGPPEMDGHYHGICPKGCFAKCCDPPGNLCGDECQKCFPKDED